MEPMVSINLKGLSKPAITLVNRTMDLVSEMYGPFGKMLEARADGVSAKRRAKDAIALAEMLGMELSEYDKFSLARIITKTTKEMTNQDQITCKAIPHVADDAQPEFIDEDWFSLFMDKAKNVNDENAQEMWGRILAKESNAVGSVSRQTIHVLSMLSSADARFFQSLRRYMIDIDGVITLYLPDYKWYEKQIDFNPYEKWSDLEAIGLIQRVKPGSMLSFEVGSNIIKYFHKTITINLRENDDFQQKLGFFELTRAGREIAPMCMDDFNQHYFDTLVYAIKKDYEEKFGCI